MITKRLILLLAGLILVLYFQHFIANKWSPDEKITRETIKTFPGDPVADNHSSREISPVKLNGINRIDQQPVAVVRSNNLRQFDIFGKVVDEYHQPIENVLISEDRYFYYTRSNLDGLYRLTVEIPKHRFPVLNFLRSGYAGDKINIYAEKTEKIPEVELNVTLVESTESIRVNGWIGNEIGENLADQKIGIFMRGFQGLKNIDQTSVSDENGEFAFEALKPDAEYELEVYTSPQYAPYSIQELLITRTSPRLNITLKKLEFIQVSGMFVDTEGIPVPNFKIDMINISTGIHVQRIVSDSSGFFSLENFPAGDIRFSSQPPEHFTITGLKLVENDYKHLTLVVDKGSHQLSGWISDQNGVGISRAMVMFDSEVLKEGISSVSNRSTVTDSTGYFQFDQLANIPHYITIYANGFDKKELLHRFRSPSSEIFIALSPQ